MAEGRPGLLTLASASPRRLALLACIGIVPDAVMEPSIDESPEPDEPASMVARRLARGKAGACPAEGFLLAADTVVSVGRRVLPGAQDEHTARKCLALLSGRAHRVHTAVVLRLPDGRLLERTSESRVGFARLTDGQIDAYLAGGEWRGKAGGYAIQGSAASFVRSFSGSHSGVVGLPLYETAQLLRGHGWHIP